jgi:desulfoferrodoxin-like iron-binding protein
VWCGVYCYPRWKWDDLLLWSTHGIEEVAFWREAMSQLGKRYRCSVCGTEILCTKAGEGAIVCCDKEMEVQEPKPLPSSD